MDYPVDLVFNNREPVYIQVIRYFKVLLATGKLKPGEEIPSRRELANMMKINATTAQKVYKEMEDQGLIKTERNFPSVVTNDMSIVKGLRKELLDEATTQFIEAVVAVEVSEAELVDLIVEQYRTVRNKKEGKRNDCTE